LPDCPVIKSSTYELMKDPDLDFSTANLRIYRPYHSEFMDSPGFCKGIEQPGATIDQILSKGSDPVFSAFEPVNYQLG
jgi:hypothetical protein